MTSVATCSNNYSATRQPDFTIIVPVSIYHHVSYAETYSRSMGKCFHGSALSMDDRRLLEGHHGSRSSARNEHGRSAPLASRSPPSRGAMLPASPHYSRPSQRSQTVS